MKLELVLLAENDYKGISTCTLKSKCIRFHKLSIMAEKGNSKLNTSTHKVIAYKIPTFMDVMKLNYSRDDKNYKAFLSALEETQIIDRVVPDISTLRDLKTSRIKDQVVHLYIKKDIKLLDSEIKSIHLVTK